MEDAQKIQIFLRERKVKLYNILRVLSLFLRDFDSLYLSIRHYLLLFFLFLSTRSTNSSSPFQSKSIQFLYTAEPRIAQRSRQYFAPPFVRVAGSGLFNIKELTAPEAVDNASHYRSCRPGRARQLIPRRTRE